VSIGRKGGGCAHLDTVIGQRLTACYHRRVHPETGRTPLHRWLGTGWLPRMPESLDEVGLLLLTVATPRKVHRNGIHCHGLRYLASTLTALRRRRGHYPLRPPGPREIPVFHGNQFLCVAVSPELAAASINLKDLQAARNCRRRELHHKLTNRRSLVDALTHYAGRCRFPLMLASRAGSWPVLRAWALGGLCH